MTNPERLRLALAILSGRQQWHDMSDHQWALIGDVKPGRPGHQVDEAMALKARAEEIVAREILNRLPIDNMEDA